MTGSSKKLEDNWRPYSITYRREYNRRSFRADGTAFGKAGDDCIESRGKRIGSLKFVQ